MVAPDEGLGTVSAMKLLPAPPFRQFADSTGAERDRVVDFLRAFSLVVVVIGHVTMAVVGWENGVPVLGNLFSGNKAAQSSTWLLQVMPLFFFAGGAANTISWGAHRDRGYAQWLWSRASRLLRPLWVYLAVMASIAFVVARFTPAKVSAPLLLLTTQLLWFLGAYLAVCALGPLLHRLDERRPLATLVGLMATCVTVDVARFALDAPEALGLVNFVAVWAVAAQLGVWYVNGRIRGLGAAGCAAVALGANVVVVGFGPYPLSMVGMPGEAISNMAPPSAALMLHAVWLCCAAVAAAPLVRAIASRVRVWRAVVLVNMVAMTLYLWHLPVLIALTVLEHAVGLSAPTVAGSTAPASGYLLWWMVHAGVFAFGVAAVVRIMWLAENARLPLWDARSRLVPLPGVAQLLCAGVGVVLCGAALLALAATGLAGFPSRVVEYAGLPLSSGMAVVVLVCGAGLVRAAGAQRRSDTPGPS